MKHKIYLNVQNFISDLIFSILLSGKYDIIENSLELNFPKKFLNMDEYINWCTKQIIVNMQKYLYIIKDINDIQELYEILDNIRGNNDILFDIELLLRNILPICLYIENKDYIYDNYFELLECFLEDRVLSKSMKINSPLIYDNKDYLKDAYDQKQLMDLREPILRSGELSPIDKKNDTILSFLTQTNQDIIEEKLNTINIFKNDKDKIYSDDDIETIEVFSEDEDIPEYVVKSPSNRNSDDSDIDSINSDLSEIYVISQKSYISEDEESKIDEFELKDTFDKMEELWEVSPKRTMKIPENFRYVNVINDIKKKSDDNDTRLNKKEDLYNQELPGEISIDTRLNKKEDLDGKYLYNQELPGEISIDKFINDDIDEQEEKNSRSIDDKSNIKNMSKIITENTDIEKGDIREIISISSDDDDEIIEIKKEENKDIDETISISKQEENNDDFLSNEEFENILKKKKGVFSETDTEIIFTSRNRRYKFKKFNESDFKKFPKETDTEFISRVMNKYIIPVINDMYEKNMDFSKYKLVYMNCRHKTILHKALLYVLDKIFNYNWRIEFVYFPDLRNLLRDEFGIFDNKDKDKSNTLDTLKKLFKENKHSGIVIKN